MTSKNVEGDAPSLRESADLDAALSLLSEGLDLCVRAKKLDEAIERAVAVGRSEDGGTQCLTPALWVQEAYDRDLGIWELRAQGLLTRLAPVGLMLGNRKDGSSHKTTDKGGE